MTCVLAEDKEDPVPMQPRSLTAYVSFLSAADQEKVFGGTAARRFKFDGR